MKWILKIAKYLQFYGSDVIRSKQVGTVSTPGSLIKWPTIPNIFRQKQV
jgi:hypothetical protein